MSAIARNTLITGVSAGIGHALSAGYLAEGWRVLGCSRRIPADLIVHEAFRFSRIDLRETQQIADGIASLLKGVACLDLVVLNAGVLGSIGDLSGASGDDLQETFLVNVVANKLLLDGVFASGATVNQVVAISSGVSVKPSRGWGGYAISKAALNMLVSLYAHERSGTHFSALAPGIVDTAMQEKLCAGGWGQQFTAQRSLRSKRGTSEMPGPDQAAIALIRAITALPEQIESGSFVELRGVRGAQ